MIFGYELIATDMYTVPAYQHVIAPEKQYQPLIEEKPKPELKKPALSVPFFKWEPKKITVYFDFNSYKLKPSEKDKLKGLKGSVILKGYASPEGSSEYNLRLSKKRLYSVKEILAGVSILKEEAQGESPCDLPQTRWHLCRKVEIIEAKNHAKKQ